MYTIQLNMNTKYVRLYTHFGEKMNPLDFLLEACKSVLNQCRSVFLLPQMFPNDLYMFFLKN